MLKFAPLVISDTQLVVKGKYATILPRISCLCISSTYELQENISFSPYYLILVEKEEREGEKIRMN
jgi:hypothetical protein